MNQTKTIDYSKYKELLSSELRYRRLFETAQDGILLIDFDTGMILDANKFLIDMLSYSKSDFLKKHLWEVGVFKDIAASKDNFKTLQKKRYVRFEDLPLETKAGEKINVEFVANAYEVGDTTIIQCNIRDITDRKKAERIAEEAREQVEAIVDTVKDPLLVLDKQLRIVSANKTFYHFFRTNKNETIGNLIYDLGNGQWNIKELKELLSTVIPQKIQIRGFIVTHNFENIGLKTMLLNGRQISLEGGKAKGILLAIEDITEQKAAEGLLSASEAKYRRLFESAKDGILILDAKTGLIVDVNQFLIDLLQFSRKEFIAKKIWDIGLFEDILANKEQLIKLQKRGYVRYENLPLKTATGKQIEVEFVSNVYNVDNQKVIQCNIRDISERKKIQKQLLESEEKFSKAFQTSPYAITITRIKDGVFLDVNDTFISMTGYKRKEALSGSSIGLKLWVNNKDREHILADLLAGRAVVDHEYKFRKKNNEVLIGSFSAQLIQLNQGLCILSSIIDITHRKETEEALWQSEKRFRAIFNATFQFTGLMTTDGILIEANQAAIDFTGHKEVDIINQPFWQTPWWSGDNQRVRKLKESIKKAAKGEFIRYEVELSGANNYKGMFDFSIKPIFDKNGKVELLVPEGRDITDRKNAETELLKKEIFLRATLDSTDDGILAVDNEGMIIHSNTRFVEFWRIPKNIIKQNKDKVLLTYVLNQLIDPKAFLKKIKQLYKTNKTSLDIINFKDGRVFERYSTPLIINQKLTGRVWSFRDISNRVRAEIEVMEAKAKSDAILASIGDAVFACDKNGNLQLFNKMAEEMTGTPAKQAIGNHYNNVITFIRECDKKLCNDFINEAIKNNKITKMANHVLLVRKDGREIPVADSAAPIINKNNEIIGCVVVFHDVTKERKIDRAKTEFVALASHQLRTPLSAINWYVEMLLSLTLGKLNPKQQQYCETVYQACQRMINLVNALLNVSRLELGTFAVEPKIVNIKKIAQFCLKELDLLIQKKKLVISEKYDKSVSSIKADPKLLTIIFQNLLSNSVKYTNIGGKIELKISEKNKGTLITVSDNGIGIPQDQQKDIFGKLYRANNAKIMDPDGSGLGLYIVKEIIDSIDGKVWFKSSEEKGTTFYTWLPQYGMVKKASNKKLV